MLEANGPAKRILKRYQRANPGGFQSWSEVICGCIGIVSVQDARPLLMACAEVADRARDDERKRLDAEKQVDPAPSWRPLMALYGRHIAEFRGEPESAQSRESAYWMRQCADVADEWMASNLAAASIQ
jgi:hypothetical protein